MHTIPAGVATLLKSRSMVGDNKPTRLVRFESVITGEERTLTADEVTAIVLEHALGMAGSCRIVLDNKDGKFSPDNSGTWERMFWPNNIITVELGYGSDTVLVFTGFIDKIEMTNFPAEIEIWARDFYKRALDQTVIDGDNKRLIEYTDTAPETIFAETAEWAGWAAGEIHTEVSDITLDHFSIDWETYADAWQKFYETTGFEVFVDNEGEIHFRQATDRQPEAVDEVVNPQDGVAVDLDHSPIVANSEGVFSAVDGGGTEYVRDTDYTMDYGNGTITWIGVPPATVYVSYVYAAWIFQEGEDIVNLGYTINDDDLHHTVFTQGAGGIRSSHPYGAADYYSIPSQKIMVVDVPEIDTHATLDDIAERVVYVMRTKVRRAEFACVGIPWLEIGDCIQVIESTSTISEIYRITSMRTVFDDRGFISHLETYYYGFTPAPGV